MRRLREPTVLLAQQRADAGEDFFGETDGTFELVVADIRCYPEHFSCIDFSTTNVAEYTC